MKRLLAVIAVALALPAAAQAKGITGLAVCGPDDCRDADVAGLGHNPPFAGSVGHRDAPPPSRFLRLEFSIDGQEEFVAFYEPVTGLVATDARIGRAEWVRLAPDLATGVEDVAKRLEPFPAPRVTGARVDGAPITGDPAAYASLLTIDGPLDVPTTTKDAVVIRLEATGQNPWTQTPILFYEDEGVIQRGGTYVKLPAPLVDDIAGGGGTTLPWLPIAVALLGAALLVALFLRTRTARRRALVAASLLALGLPATAQAKGPIPAELCGPDACRAVTVALHFVGSEAPPAPGPYYELRVDYGNGSRSTVYYEPRSGLVAHTEDFGAVTWVPLPLGEAVSGLRPYPAPRVTAAWVGERRVYGDPSGYLRLVTLNGPFVVPEHLTEFAWIRLESPTPNPWTSQPLVYYPSDRVLLVPGATYVQVPDAVAADLAGARAVGDGSPIVPWIALAVALAGAVALLLLRTLGVWSGSLRPSSSSTWSGRRRWRPARTRRSSAAA